MPILVLLNGGPASGKSTLARLWAARRPLALALDIDVVRALIPGWEDDPVQAGRAARDLAVAMARSQLEAGRDVIVPQFLARAEFVDRLSELARDHRVPFVHIVLRERADVAEARFAARASAAYERGRDCGHGALQGPLGAPSMAELLAAHDRFIDERPEATVMHGIDGDIPASLEHLTAAITRASMGPSLKQGG